LTGLSAISTKPAPVNLVVHSFDGLLVPAATLLRTEVLRVFEHTLALFELIAAFKQLVFYLARIHLQHLELVAALLTAEQSL
jgi:hypothetical protein